MESSYIAEASVSQGRSSLKSCPINTLCDDVSGKVVINDGSAIINMNDVQKIPSQRHYIEKYEDGDEDDEEDSDDFSEEELLTKMGYGISKPKRVIKIEHQKQCNDDEDNLLEESLLAKMDYLKNEPPKHEPIITPTAALDLVSALKGSREKAGMHAKECRVSWAPDVIDSPPSSAEHFAKTNTERHKSEHKVKGAAGRNRQKVGGKGAGGLEGGGGKASKFGGNKGTVGGGGGKEAAKDKKKKEFKKKHGGSASKYSNIEDD